MTLHIKWYIIRTYGRSLMVVKNTIYALNKYGYKVTNIDGGDYIVLIRPNEEKISSVVIIDDTKYPHLADAQQCEAIKQSFESTYLFRGYENVEMLFLILTDNPFEYKNFSEGKLIFWVADICSERLLSFIDNDGPFNYLRNIIESALSRPTDNDDTIKNRTFGNFFSQHFITIALIIINVLLFIYKEAILDNIEQYIFRLKYSNISTVTFEAKQYYRLFTSTFLHVDFSHLTSNMVCLFFIGYSLEPVMGHIKFILLYLTSGIFASVCSVVYFSSIGRFALCMGASGAVYGVLGALVIYALLSKIEKYKISITRILFLIGFSIVVGIQNTNVDHAAHIGGVVFGIILAYIFCKFEKNKKLNKNGASFN